MEKEMATHFRTLVWKIPWTEEPSRLQSMRLQRVGDFTFFSFLQGNKSFGYHTQKERDPFLTPDLMTIQRAFLCAKSLPSGPTLYDPIDCSPPGSSVPGVLQVRMLEWVTVSLSRGSSQPRGPSPISYVSCIGRWAL